ncbi:MAG TPA: hypothetical protein VGH31_10870 [Acidimicrobiales bacterium]
MYFDRARLGLGVALGGAAMLASMVLPAASASAAEHSVHQLVASKGTNPNSPFCKLYHKQLTTNTKSEKALTKAMESGNWKATKRALLVEFSSEKTVEKNFIKALSSAPATVRSAGKAALKVIPVEEKAINTSTSVTGYEKAIEAVVDTKKMQAVGTVFENYESTTCGTAS